MRLFAQSPRQTTLWVCLCALFISLPTAFAQEPGLNPPSPPAEAEPGEPADDQPQAAAEDEDKPDAAEVEDVGPMLIDIDIERLIFDNRGSGVPDPVWRLQPSTGRRILLLPFTVDNVHRPYELSRFPISVRAGRLVGFVIPKAEADARGGGGEEADLNQIIRAAPGELQQLLFESAEDQADVPAEADDPPQIDPLDDDAPEPTPQSAPRLAREITLHPEGTVQWEMDRNIRGAELQSPSERNPYAYKIDPRHLRDAQPERAERLSRNEGEDSRAYAQRKREHLLAEREKQNAYRELRDSLRNLPERFSDPMPPLLYAAIEMPDDDTLSLEGPAPFPWTVDADKKQLLEELSRNANALQQDGAEQLAGRLITMIEDHPLDARAIAYALQRSRLAGQVEVDSPGYRVLARLVQSDDLPTRRIALYSAAAANPPTLASAKLIGVAGEAALGEERKMLSFASLSKLMSTQADDPDNARVLIDRVGQTISDPQGPNAPQIMERVLASLDPGQGDQRGQASSEARAVMIDALDLSGLDKDEFEGVARAVIQHAPRNPIAAGWLDQQLLGSTDRDLVNAALIALYESKVVPTKENERYEQGAAADAAPQPAIDADAIVLSDTIPMTRTDHALIALFNDDDDARSAAAWAVVGRFHIALDEDGARAVLEAPGRDAQGQPAVDPTVALFDSILDKARQRERMPASVIDFIVHQKDPALATVANDRFAALLALGLAQKPAHAAVEAYIAQPDRFTQAIGALAPADQMKLMQTMYRAQDEDAPLIAGLIADRGQAMNWFTGFVKDKGELPTRADWNAMAQEQSESALLQSASDDDVTIATAGAAALVATSGGNAQHERAFVQTVALMSSREPQLVKAEWEKQRVKILTSAFEDAAGTYELVATLLERAEAPPADNESEAATQSEKRIDLGIVELIAEGVELSLSAETVQVSSLPDKLGIRLENPSSLRSFSKPELTAISTQQLARPIDLLPNEQGAWVGETSLRDGRTLRVSLEPTR